jgi:single-stranded DNA-binding protein
MRGLNKVVLAGNATGKIDYAKTDNGKEVCTFVMASDRHGVGGAVTTAFVKVNVYLDGLVQACRTKLTKGCYLLLEGELMNRHTPSGQQLEVRVWDIVFLPSSDRSSST